jgi:Helix-turn-helix domain
MTTLLTVSDDANWYTKQDAAAALGVSTKTVENYARDGKIGQALYRRAAGGPQLAVFSREDVDHLVTNRQDGAIEQSPRVVAAASSNGQALTPPPAKRHGGGGLDPAIVQALLHRFQETSQNAEKLFLTIPEAARFSGLSEAYIRRACQAGSLAAIRDAGWKIKRAALASL